MITEKVKSRYIVLLFLIAFLTIIQAIHSDAGTVVVKPGKFDHFTLQVPEKITAGEIFIVKVQAFDANNNLITNFSETGKSFRVFTDGSATIQPSMLSTSSFSGGTANISINSRKAEKLVFSIQEAGGSVPIISKELTVSPNKLDHFILQAPQKITAGSKFDVRVTAKDLFDNTVEDINIGNDFKITSTGTSSVKVVGSSSIIFKNGMGTTSFMSEKVGDLTIELQEVSTGSRGRTETIMITPSSLSYFKLQAPKNVIAGEPFDLLVAAYDSFDNIVTNYSAIGNGVILATSGISKIDPAAINPSDFRNGQAVVEAIYEKAEDIKITAKESNREQIGESPLITVSNAGPEVFVVVTPQTAVSGQRFKIKIEAYDKFNNLVKNYNLIGNDVILNTSGTGSISNSVVNPSEFVNGIATVDVVYDKAESFLISAAMAPDRTPGRISLKEPEIFEDVPKIEEIKKIPVEKAEEPPEKPLPETKPVTETMIVKTPAKKKSRPRKTDAPTIVHKKAEEDSLKVKPDEKPAPVSEEKPETIKPKAPPVKEEVTPERVIPRKEEEPVEVAKRVEEKVERPVNIFTVSNVSIIEAKNRSMLVFNLTNPNGQLEYTDEIESRYGKEWLKLVMKPATYKTKKKFQFQSAFVGQVLLEEEEGKPQVLNVFVELIPSGVTFDIARVKNNLIVTLASP